jgi:hypothetical protein
MAMAITGTVSAIETSSRVRSACASSGTAGATSPAGAPGARAGRGRCAVYPTASTAAMRSSGDTESGAVTVARSVA